MLNTWYDIPLLGHPLIQWFIPFGLVWILLPLFIFAATNTQQNVHADHKETQLQDRETEI